MIRQSEHTPTPWCVPAGDQNGFIICTGDDPAKPGPILVVLRNPLGRGFVPTDFDINANAAFIVKAVNSHDALVKKLEEIHDITQDTTLGVECWQKLQNIAATAASALASLKERA